MTKTRISNGVRFGLAVVLAGSCFGASAAGASGPPPAPSPQVRCVPTEGCIPTFSTQNLGRMGDFYVGGNWVGKSGEEVMHGTIFVEVWVPKKIGTLIPSCSCKEGAGKPSWPQYKHQTGGRDGPIIL